MDECWDNSDTPPYVPQLEDKKVIRKVPSNLSKAAKRKFYESERIRWAKIRETENRKKSDKNTDTATTRH